MAHVCAYPKDPRPSAGGFVQMRAFSKINLILDVLRKRSDGYHDLRSVMQMLALHDTVTISISKNNNGFQLICSDPALPTDDRNLVTKAAKFLIKEYNIVQPICIQLEKRIPQAAGLAGGSSDCAATLVGINQLFDLNIPLHTLMEIGQRFGADVPFCLLGGTALAEGIGEKLTPLPVHPHCWVLLACPDIYVSTAAIFNKCKPGVSNNIDDMITALAKGNLRDIAKNFNNDLADVTIKLHPIIQKLINEMITQGAMNAAMSGSGPSVFGYFLDKETAKKTQVKIENITGRTFLTETIN